MVKRLADVFAASFALLVLSPLLVLVSLAILLSDGRPIIYNTQRVGRDGEVFTILKFRTMRNHPESEGSRITASGDTRITRVGSFLRRTKIDELPQLLNVLRGEMSVVGPRPEDPQIVRECYSDEYMTTLAVRPGLASPGSLYNYETGELLLGCSNAEEMYRRVVLPRKMELEMEYLRGRGLRRDMAIILRTAIAITTSLNDRRGRNP